MDANEHVGETNISDIFRAIGLTEAILDRHKNKASTQPTYQRGSEPIDGIFVSANIEVEASGYLPFGDAPSDHRVI